MRQKLKLMLPDWPIEKVKTLIGQQNSRQEKRELIVPTPLEGWGGSIYSNGFFVQSILTDRYIYRGVVSGIIKKPAQRRIQNLKDFYEFRFLQQVIDA